MSMIEVPTIVPLVLVILLFAIGFWIVLRGLFHEIARACKNQKNKKTNTKDVGLPKHWWELR